MFVNADVRVKAEFVVKTLLPGTAAPRLANAEAGAVVVAGGPNTDVEGVGPKFSANQPDALGLSGAGDCMT